MTSTSTTSSENLGKKSGRIKRRWIKNCPYPMPPGEDKVTHRSDSSVTVVTPENETKMILERITVLQMELKE